MLTNVNSMDVNVWKTRIIVKIVFRDSAWESLKLAQRRGEGKLIWQ